MSVLKKSMIITITTLGIGITATSISAQASTPWEFTHTHEYKVRVLKPTNAYRITYGKYTYQNKWSKPFKLHRGEVVRTWYAGAGGFGYHLTGGYHEKYSRDKYGYDVEWKSHKSFKILHTYKGTDWF